MSEELKNKAAALPDKPGIYIFRDNAGIPVYIGKARSLRLRVGSYFLSTRDRKILQITAETADIETIMTGTEKEAAFLENNFIRRYQPKFNLRLKDDKHFPYIKVTAQEEVPRIYLARRVEKDGARYFGPFSPAHQARKTIHLIAKTFGIRTCRENIPGHRSRPCLDYDLGLCAAPCVDMVSEEEYADRVRSALLFLEGKVDMLKVKLKLKMRLAAKEKRFEDAARWRDFLRTLEEIKARPQFITAGLENKDIFGMASMDDLTVILFFPMRRGRLIESSRSVLSGRVPDGRSFLPFLQSHYEGRSDLPDTLVLPLLPEGHEPWLADLSSKKGKKISLVVPQRGTNKKLLDFAGRNAESALKMAGEARLPLRQLQELFHLKHVPQRIEGYDISNTGGDESVGSMVVFEGGIPNTDEYRRFNIQTVDGPNDIASLKEVLTRRFKKLDREGGAPPDLILIDGGKGQLRAAEAALAAFPNQSIPVVSIAKREEILFSDRYPDGLRLDRTSSVLKLLQNVRDEAHRFAITLHRRKREKRSFSSILDDIPGIGPSRKTKLLKHFNGTAALLKASEEELAALVGPKTARFVHSKLHEQIDR
ncbi:MAG: excinuclease ABC subunit UvrC [Acidobacteria bacterium]|nr:excinuclease ABC subunit UvrC [Acidobacteriota bacterium]MBU1475020.1 excinuclease ABC subunit UvrC [Acidobacteriota bacterium]MBU2438138.1 excinuclease ABC subunit UvrC [Acidobacteriota bacterium]